MKFLSISLSKGIAFVFAAVIGYLFNKYWTFVKHDRSFSEVSRYLIVQIFLLGFNVGTNKAILVGWPSALFPAMVVASVSTAVVSFVLKKAWVFK